MDDGWLFVTLATPQLSPVVGEPKDETTAEQFPASLLTLILDGQLIVGFSLSVTVTVCWHWLRLPWISATVQVTIVVPIG